MKFQVMPNKKFDLPQYNFDHVKNNPGLYVGAGTDKSCLYSAPGMKLYFGHVNWGVYGPLGDVSWYHLTFNKVEDFIAEPHPDGIKITIKSLPTPNIKLEYGDVILWRGQPHLVMFNSIDAYRRGLVSLYDPGLTYSTLPGPTEFTYLGTLTKEI